MNPSLLIIIEQLVIVAPAPEPDNVVDGEDNVIDGTDNVVDG